jgi:hypothetical protein
MIGNAVAGLFGVGVAPSTTAYESIATQTVGASAVSSITFSSIPSTYTHLQIRSLWKGSITSFDYEYVELTINGSSSGYAYHNIRGDGSAVVAGGGGSLDRTYPSFSLPSSNASYANMFGTGIIDILDYTNTNKNKTIRALSGFDGNGSGNVSLSSGLWQNTSAITSISLKPQSGSSNFTQYSQFALYGIKGA